MKHSSLSPFIYLTLVAFVFSGCKKAITPAKEVNTTDRETLGPINTAARSQAPATPSNDGKVDNVHFIEDAVSQIKTARSSSHPVLAGYTIRALFRVWTPVGKTPKEIMAMLGEPTRVSHDKLEYMLYGDVHGSQGGAGAGFNFYISDGKIVEYDDYTIH